MARQNSSNRERASRAEHALNSLSDGVSDESITDLLTDLRHLCESNGYDFDNLNSIAEDHFETESKELWGPDEILI